MWIRAVTRAPHLAPAHRLRVLRRPALGAALALLGALAACDSSPPGGEPDRACNGHVALCDRPYDQVAYPTAHNAMSNDDDGWIVPNHLHGISDQLAAGVRGFMLDLHDYEGEVTLCHGPCDAGNRPLVAGLGDFAAFLEAHPREVLTIIFESYVSATDTAAAFAEAGLSPYLHAHDPATPWPTLGALIDAGETLVVFTDQDGGDPPWYHPVWDHAFETHYHYEAPEEMVCTVNRGSEANALFILNHFLTRPVALQSFAEQVNVNPFFLDRAERCQAERGHLPNFVTVDFWSIGDLFPVVDALNGL